MSTTKTNILFVGSFHPPAGREVKGGQLYACQAILRSPLSDHVNWTLLDSTMESVPPPGVWRRCWLAWRRLLRFGAHLIFKKIDAVLIFTSNGGSFYEKGLMVVLARLAGKRAVLCPRSGFILDDYRKGGMMRRYIPWICRRASAVVCQGQSWKIFFEQVSGLPEEHLPIIGNCIEPAGYGGLSPLQPKETTKALLMGWIERNKGIFDLVEVVDRFRWELQGMKFVICGRGAEWDALLSKIAEKKLELFFDLRGWVSDTQKLAVLADTDIYLMLSYREGLPNALLEAMASGRAVIATAVGAVPDAIEDGQNGLLCEPGDIDQIGRHLIRLAGDFELRARLGRAAQCRIREAYSPEILWRRWLKVLQG